MFYQPENGHGLPHDPFKALVVPRPIAWVSTVALDGTVNLAPYSFFNGVADAPPIVVFCPNGPHAEGGAKDSLANLTATGEFVVNIVTEELTRQMNTTSADAPRSVDEMQLAGLEPAPCRVVKPPRVAASPVALECRHLQTVELPSTRPDVVNSTVFGEVVGVHIDEAILTDGMVDWNKFHPLSRLGYMDYCVVNNHFTLHRPG